MDGEPRIYDDVQTLDDGYDRGDARAGLYVPIEDHGVISINATTPGVFEQADVELASILATHTATVLDRLQQERELTRQNDRLEQFASVLSHDLRNPLNVASGRLELARQECESSHHDAVERAHQRMEQIIGDVLTLTRGDESVEEREAIELEATVESCWRNAETADGTVQVEANGTFFGDCSRVRHVFENLFRNAVEHTSGTVTIRIGPLDDGFYVEDDGPGIPPEDRDQIFEYGYSTNPGGTGLGLAIVEQIVADHGWDITIIEGRDGGVRFEITASRENESADRGLYLIETARR